MSLERGLMNKKCDGINKKQETTWWKNPAFLLPVSLATTAVSIALGVYVIKKCKGDAKGQAYLSLKTKMILLYKVRPANNLF